LVYRSERLHTPFPFSKPVDPTGVTLAKSGISHLRTVQFDNEPVRVIDVPLYNPQHQVEGVVEMSYWLGDIYRVLATLAGTLILILPVGILLMGLASTYVVGKTLRPVREITGTAARMSAEDLSGRLPVSGNDEFAELAETMNGLLGRLETAFGKQKLALSQLQEVVEQQRKFTADASHELKTPLAIVKINASILKSSLEEHPDASESLDAIDEAVNRMSKLVQDLMLLARTDTGQLREQFEPVDLAESAQKAKSLVPCGGKIRLSGDKSVWLNGSRFALERLVVNLLENACRYTNQDGRVELSVHQEGSEAVLIVSDDGVGIPPEHLENIFKRFHRVDESRQSDTGGNGLGLAICKGIVEAHQGTISVSSSLGEGATFTVRIPIRHQDLSSQS
jgi:signal transduction histidine kinase